ncbi:MAG: hypothetical protein R3F17_11915, partial [Planctomycetota bacterium]
SFMESTGGRMVTRSRLRWAIPVEATEVGEFTLPELTVWVGGQERNVKITPSTLKVVKDVQADELGLLELPNLPTTVYEGQPFELRLRVGWVRRLNVRKASLTLPWWNSLPGMMQVKGPGFQPQTGQVQPLMVNGDFDLPFEVRPDEDLRGEPFRVFEFRTTVIATRSGRLDFATSTFMFAEEVGGQRSRFTQPSYREYYATVPAFSIDVLRVPEKGRPLEWGGAVGELTAERKVSSRDVSAGESMQLEVTWTGMANVEFFDTPDLKKLDSFSGFRVLGHEDSNIGMERRVVYDLVPLSDEVTQVPPVPLWIFDPATAAFKKIETEPVPIRVTGGGDLNLDAAFGPEQENNGGGRDLMDLLPVAGVQAGSQAASGKWYFAGWAGLLLGWLVLRKAVRRHGDPDSVLARARRRALRDLDRALAGSGEPLPMAHAVQRFLAQRSGEPAAAWVGRDPVVWAQQHGASEAGCKAAERLNALLGQLDAAAFARSAQTPARGELLAAAKDFAREVHA